jgi:hypothetical protein
MLCPCRVDLPVTTELVARLEAGADDTRIRTLVA